MRTVKQITHNKYLNIKEVTDPEHHTGNYQFAERRGIDSVAFICWDEEHNLFLLNKEYTPPTNEFHFRAFGGSLDKDIPKKEIVRGELKEEAGFDTFLEMRSLGPVFVSTQMNQYCYLFLVKVDPKAQGERRPENLCESLATVVWRTKEEILLGDDWKAITIISKAFANK